MLTKKSDNDSKTCQEKFKSSDFKQGEFADKLEGFVKEIGLLKEEIKTIKKSNSKLKETVNTLNGKIGDYDQKFERMERDRKKSNISIEGVIEIENLSLEKFVNNLFEDLGLDYKVSNVCHQIYREGKYVAPSAGFMPRPRPIVVKLYDESFKFEIFKNIKNMAGKEKWKNVFVNEG